MIYILWAKTGRKATMTLSIGNNFRRGFTLVEVMVATAVLALAMVLIYQAFFISLDSFNYCADYLDVVSFLDEKIWLGQDSVSHSGTLIQTETQGEFVYNNRKFSWVLTQETIEGASDLYRIDGRLTFREGKKNIEVSRAAYAIYEKG
jgi:prepilin-type N-terminal cleavage/methylation domain-containing protein